MRDTLTALKVSSLALLLLAPNSCEEPPPAERYVRVTVNGINNDVQFLRVYVSVNDAMLPRSPRVFENNNSKFWIPIDQSTHGSISITVEALKETCQIANGKIDGEIRSDQVTDFAVNLAFLPSRLCRVSITTKGEGSVVSNPTGINCGSSCESDFPYGTALTLTATPKVPTFPAAWRGLCEGKQGVCTITLNQSVQLGVDFVPKVCNSANWCWESPLPQGNSLAASWVAPDNTVYAVGDAGTAIKWNGAGWFGLETGTRDPLFAVYGFNADDVWAVGDKGFAAHWNGTFWTRTPTGSTKPLRAVWGFAPNDVWAAGDGGEIVRWDGTAWTLMPHSSTPITNIWGFAKNDIWAVGGDNNIRRWNGTQWNYIVPPTVTTFNDVWGSAANDVWISAENGFWRWNGASWQQVSAPIERYSLRLKGTGPNNVWAIADSSAILRWQGAGWNTAMEPRGGFQPLAGLSVRGTDAWFVGGEGLIIHWDGSAFQDSSKSLTTTSIRSGCGLSGDDAWLVGDQGSTYRWRGLAFASVKTGATSNLNEVWCGPPSQAGMPSDAVWAVGDNGTALLWNGFEWSAASTGIAEPLLSITGSSSSNVWISGTSTLLHWNGASFEKYPNQGGRKKLALMGSDLYGISSSIAISQFKQGAWQDFKPSTTCSIQALAIAGSDIYIGGSEGGRISPGCIRKWTGSDWIDVWKPAYNASDLMATGPTDVWSLSANFNGEIVRYDGTGWRAVDTGTKTRVERIFSSGPQDRFIISSAGTILHLRE